MENQKMKTHKNSHTEQKNKTTTVVEIQNKNNKEKPISNSYKVIDNDLARDNLENDITSADLQDL